MRSSSASPSPRGYSNLEYELGSGERGSRDAPRRRIASRADRRRGRDRGQQQCGGDAAGAGRAGRRTARSSSAAASWSRSAARSGSRTSSPSRAPRLVEVGTTNRTRLADYAEAIGEHTSAILRVHQSNFRIVGFTEQPDAAELPALARERGIAMVDDLGSGALEPVHGEPTVRAAVAAGADLVCCSGDKLLGGPQAGILAGRREAVERCRRHPLARAMRLDKLQLAALEGTLRAAPRRRRRGGAGAGDDRSRRGGAGGAGAQAIASAIGEAADVERDAGAPGGGSLRRRRARGPGLRRRPRRGRRRAAARAPASAARCR